jgi:stage II sporulation protein AA (anti-sigma F factor antagonist)
MEMGVCYMFHLETREKVMVVAPSVEIDHHSAERIRNAVDAAFEKSPCTHMVFDFTKVGFMDSSGIGMIIGRYKQTEKRGGALALAHMNEAMTRLYTISGLAKIIRHFPSVEEALTALKGGSQ